MLLFLLNSFIFGMRSQICDLKSNLKVLPISFPQAQFETQIMNQQNFGFGIWFKWQPMLLSQFQSKVCISLDENEKLQSYFLYLVKSQNNSNLLKLWFNKDFDYQNSVIFLNLESEVLIFENESPYLEVNLEGVWIFFYTYLDFFDNEAQFFLYFSESKEYKNFVFKQNLNLQGSLIHIIGQPSDNSTINGNLSQFLGKIIIVGQQNEAFSIQNCERCFSIINDCKEDHIILIENTIIQGSNYLMFKTQSLEKQIYQLAGWSKLNFIQPFESISIIKIFQMTNNKSQKSQINLTYSFLGTNTINITICSESDLSILNCGFQNSTLDFFSQWHYLQFDIGNLKNKAAIQIYSYFFEDQIKIQIEEFSYTGLQNVFIFGEGLFSIELELVNLKYQSFCDFQEHTVIPNCHYSCLTCFGPFLDNCLTCYEQGNPLFYNNQCICKTETIEPQEPLKCITIPQAFSFIQEAEEEIKSNNEGYDYFDKEGNVICSYGYFQYKNKCIKCPFFDAQQSVINIICLDCYLNPNQFYLKPQCSIDALSYLNDKENVFYQKQRNENDIEYFEIVETKKDQYYLKLSVGKIAENNKSCKKGYFQQNNECFSCSIACSQCSSFWKCNECKEGYFLNPQFQCEICINCEQCKYKEGKIKCLKCPKKYYLNEENQCVQCGQFCASCDNKGFCYYCEDFQKYFISLKNGKDCEICNIKNCRYCYNYPINDNLFFFPYYQFSQINYDSIGEVLKFCAKCQSGFTLVYDQISLSYCDNTISSQCYSCLKFNDFLQCTCWSYDNPFNQLQENCLNGDIFQCWECKTGYYLDFETRICMQCPDNFYRCTQYYMDVLPYGTLIFGDTVSEYKDYMISTLPADKIIIGFSCSQGYVLYQDNCIQDCYEGCLKCEIINQQSICVKCNSTEFGFQKSLDSNGKCQTCPINCAACLNRNSEEINYINRYFVQNSSNEKYSKFCFYTFGLQNKYLNLFITQNKIVQCKNFLKCKKIISFQWNLYCDLNLFTSIQENSHSQLSQNYYIKDFFALNIINKIEENLFVNYLNDVGFTQIDVNLNLIQGNVASCKFSQEVIIQLSFFNTIFPLQNLNLKIFSSNKCVLSEAIVQIQGFSSITFDNLQFEYLRINFTDEKINEINLFNCDMINSESQKSQLILKQIANFNIQNFSINNINYNNQQIFLFLLDLQNTGTQVITIKDLTILDSQYFNSSLIYIYVNNKNQKVQLEVTGVKIINTTFQISNLILSEGGKNIFAGKMKFETFKFTEISLIDSQLFSLQNVQKASFSQIQVDNSSFRDQSYFILSNNFQCFNFIVSNINLSFSFLISNYVDSYYQSNENSTIDITIFNFRIIQINYDNAQAVLQLIKFQNFYNQVNVTLLQIIESKYQSNDLNTLVPQENVLIFIDCLGCNLDQIFIDRESGLPEISIVNSQKIFISNSIFTSSLKNKRKNLHPSNFDCFKQFNSIYQFYYIYIAYYGEINIDNLQIIDAIAHNHPFALIVGNDKQSYESIQIKNSEFRNNILTISENNSTASIIQIISQINCSILIQNTYFGYNHLNEYIQDLTIISSTTMFVQLKFGEIQIVNCNFFNNIITNSTDSILYLKADTITISETYFYQSNQLNFTNLVKQIIFEDGINQVNIRDLKESFQIYSNGGNGHILAKNLKLLNLSICQSYSMQGGAFYINIIGDSQILIENNTFYQIQAQLLSNLNSFGGCLYIDAQLSNLTLIIKNTTFDSTYSRTKGGALYIIPSYSLNTLLFQEIKIIDCFSIQSSFLDFSSKSWKTMITTFEFVDIAINQTKKGFEDFLSQLDQFTTTESSYFLNSNPLFYIAIGKVIFRKIDLFSEVGLFLFQIDRGQSIYLTDLYVQNGFMFSTPLLKINIESDLETEIKFNNFQMSNLQQFIDPNISQICQNENSLNMINFECHTPNFDISKQIQLTDNFEDILKNQFICNQQMFYATKKYNFSLIEISNLEKTHAVEFREIIFKFIICNHCQYGLINLLNIESNNQTNIKFSELVFQNCNCGLASCLTIIQDEQQNDFKNTVLKQSRVLQLQNYYKIAQQVNLQVVLSNSKFISNTAKFGGAVAIIGVNVLILNTYFINNTAKVGGAIYYEKNSTQLLLISSEIINNSADVAGGIFLFDSQFQEASKLDVLVKNNNSTFTENDILEKPRQLAISVDGGLTLLQKMTIFNTTEKLIEQTIIEPYKILGYKEKVETLTFPSGQAIGTYSYIDFYTTSNVKYNLTFRVIALNKFFQQVTSLDGAKCTLSFKIINITNQEELKNLTAQLSYQEVIYDTQTNDFNLDDLVIQFNPYYEKEVVLRVFIICACIAIPIEEELPPYLITKTVTNYQLQVDIRTFPCQLGEYFNSTAKICTKCDPSQNQYQIILNATSCLFKDELKINQVRSQAIELKPNYWRAYFSSTKIEQCFHLNENCLGSWYPGDASCSQGHIGALCEQCDLYNIRGHGNFATKKLYKCGSCDQIVGNVITIFLIYIWTVISVLMSVSSTIETVRQFLAGKYLLAFGVRHLNKKSSTAVLIKIFTNYSQIIQTISTFQLKVPENIVLIFDAVGNPIEQMAYSLDCFLAKISDIPIIYFRIIWSLLMAASYIFTFFILQIAAIKFKKVQFNISMVTTAFIYIFIYLQANINQYLISLVSFRIISEVSWVSGNVSYKYNTSQHKAWLLSFCLPLLLFFSIIVPSFMYFKLRNQKQQLDSIRTRETWGYLYNEYKLKAYYWEFVKILQKECIIIVLSYYEDYITIKGPLVFLFIFSYSYLTTSASPYLTGELNKFDIQSTTICGVSIILGSAIYSAQSFNLIELVYPFYTAIILLNSFFLLKIIFNIIAAYLDLLHQYTDKIKAFISLKFQKKLQKYPQIASMLESKTTKNRRIKANFEKIKKFLIVEARKNLSFKKLSHFESEYYAISTIHTSIQRLYQKTLPHSNSEK